VPKVPKNLAITLKVEYSKNFMIKFHVDLPISQKPTELELKKNERIFQRNAC